MLATSRRRQLLEVYCMCAIRDASQVILWAAVKSERPQHHHYLYHQRHRKVPPTPRHSHGSPSAVCERPQKSSSVQKTKKDQPINTFLLLNVKTCWLWLAFASFNSVFSRGAFILSVFVLHWNLLALQLPLALGEKFPRLLFVFSFFCCCCVCGCGSMHM